MPRFIVLLALASGFLFGHFVRAQTMGDAGHSDIINTLRAEGSFSILLDLFEKTGLTEMLLDGGPFTVFAPPDSAFEGATVREMSEEEITNLTARHVVMERLTASGAEHNPQALNVLGESLVSSVDEGLLRVNGAEVVRADIEASNGVIHIVSTLLQPALEQDVQDGY